MRKILENKYFNVFNLISNFRSFVKKVFSKELFNKPAFNFIKKHKKIALMVIAGLIVSIPAGALTNKAETTEVINDNYIVVGPYAVSKDEVKASLPEETYEVITTPELSTYEKLLQVLSEEDITLLAKITVSEVGNQPYECKVACVKTVLNRVNSYLYPNTVKGVLEAPNQYNATYNDRFNQAELNDELISVIYDAYFNTYSYPDDMFYFRTDYYHEGYVPYIQIGNTYFSLQG